MSQMRVKRSRAVFKRGEAAKPRAELRSGHFAEDQTGRSEEHTSELQSRRNLVCRLLLEKKKI